MAENMDDLDPEKVAVTHKVWQLPKKGEIVMEKDFFSKYVNFSEKHLKDNYQQQLLGRVKYYKKMAVVRAAEPHERKISKGSAISDISSRNSMFKGSMVKELRQSQSVDSLKPKSMPESSGKRMEREINERIGKLIESDAVQRNCNVQPFQGTKYLFFGGGSTYSMQFRKHSKEDPWQFPYT